MKIDNKGQITVELLLLISFTLITAIVLANIVIDSNELNIAMTSARNGAFEGASSNGLAIFPKESYDNYSRDNKKISLLKLKDIKIVKITESIKGKDAFAYTKRFSGKDSFVVGANFTIESTKTSFSNLFCFDSGRSIFKSYGKSVANDFHFSNLHFICF